MPFSFIVRKWFRVTNFGLRPYEITSNSSKGEIDQYTMNTSNGVV